MNRFYCASDIGSVLIGNDEWTFAVPNIGGDGTTDVGVFDSDEEFKTSHWCKDVKFLSSVQGRFGIYDYDCAFEDLRQGVLVAPVTVLEGRYGIYNGFYKAAFVKWGCYDGD